MTDPGWTAATYGDGFADVYDQWYGDVSDVDATVDAVAALLTGTPGRVLELGVGTGRLALPLAAAGLRVTGIDASVAMLARLASNDRDDLVDAVHGDMAGRLPTGPFDVVLAAYNTFFNLTTEAAQRSCLAGVAGVLAPGGSLLIEAFVPAAGAGIVRHVEPRVVDSRSVVLDVSITDGSTQTARGQQIEIDDAGGVRLRPWSIRYLTAEQLDELAASTGLRLHERWSDWDRAPMSVGAVRHVSRYGR